MQFFFSENKCFVCIALLSLLVFSFLYFSALSIVFFFPILLTKIAEAGMKGEMNHLDAPDA